MSKALLPPGSIHGSSPVPSLSPSPSILQIAAWPIDSAPFLCSFPTSPVPACTCCSMPMALCWAALTIPAPGTPVSHFVPSPCALFPLQPRDGAGTSLQQGAESFQGTTRSTDARGECTTRTGDGPLRVTNARRAEGCCTPPGLSQLHMSLHAPRTTQLCPRAGWKLSVPSPWGRRLWHLHSSSRMGQSVGAASPRSSSPMVMPSMGRREGVQENQKRWRREGQCRARAHVVLH